MKAQSKAQQKAAGAALAAKRGEAKVSDLVGASREMYDEMTEAELDLYDVVLSENDQDLYLWVTGQAPAPGEIAPMIARIAETAASGPDPTF